ncbi:META domain-containing protein [Spirosoma montaniterrae]|uniref:DUF306 domain-containing protein n=1 Tax=Spirosoma montaniterrae TaxID=1178516 RepID=A0A1P9WSH7_9BACT|nr:META domain-containing protein [Spirosoma montaniterrae]AQG78322.1 hypothetical protein AWR27_02595 [Spirosoma montaniterrae]
MRIFLIYALLVSSFSCHRPSRQIAAMMTPTRTETPEVADYTRHIRAGNSLIANGTEPFWSLTINISKNRMTFTTVDGDSIVTKVPERLDDVRGAFRYDATAESNRLMARFRPDSCVNAMSGQRFDYAVEVTANGKTYTGCGASLGQLMSLNDIWVLKTLHGQPVTVSPPQKELPYIEINLSEGRIGGLAGCNRIMGSVRADTRQVDFGRLATTMMACPGETAQLENSFLKALEGPLSYQIADMTLTLMRDGKPVATFKKVD